jgi:hypothetical protein
MSKYRAAWIKGTVEVRSYDETRTSMGAEPRRTVEVSFHEAFDTDEGLDKAIDSLAATIREAARR